jgi:hypothetical protein
VIAHDKVAQGKIAVPNLPPLNAIGKSNLNFVVADEKQETTD